MSTQSPFRMIPAALGFHVSRRPRVYIPAGTIAAILIFVSFLLLLPPAGFPTGEVVLIEEGVPFSRTAQMLEDRHVVNSALVLRVLAKVGAADERVKAGRYMFSRPQGLTTVLHRLVYGETGIPSVKVTFPEGTTVREMAAILSERIPGFSEETFISLAKEKEGYLFPDTYHVPLDAAPEDVVMLMEATFSERFEELEDELASSGRTRDEVVTMASLIEKEANTPEDRHMISGILWKRADQGRGLQVDAVFGYIKGTGTYHPSLADLEIDSPYNTYRYPGLPPGPIANPGLDSLRAALSPTESEYLYYLTGTDGVTRYARTFEEHKENRGQYLD